MSGSHWHADLLAVQCAVSGEPCLIDPGTYSYAPHPEWREFFRSAAAHSTVRVDAQEPAVRADPLRWEAHPPGRLRRWLSTPACDFADAESDADDRFAGRVSHRRRVLFVKPHYWVIVDDVDGSAEHRIELGFQFAARQAEVRPDLWACVHGAGGRGLLLRPWATVRLRAEVRVGEVSPIRGWVSPDYGQRRPAAMLTYSAVTRLPVRILTLLWPTMNSLGVTPAVGPLVDDAHQLVGLVFEDGGGSVRFGDDELIIARDGTSVRVVGAESDLR